MGDRGWIREVEGGLVLILWKHSQPYRGLVNMKEHYCSPSDAEMRDRVRSWSHHRRQCLVTPLLENQGMS